MSALRSLFKQTFIYGLATVLPRMLSFLLVPLYTTEGVLSSVAEYGQVSVIFSYFVVFNVILAYGMETAFFRFFNKQKDQEAVLSTSAISLVISSVLFVCIALYFQDPIAKFIDIPSKYINLVIWILLLDALVIIPFAWLRATERPMRYAIIKIVNVAINLGLNIFFLLALPSVVSEESLFKAIYRPDFEISYIFIANLVASAFTFILLLGFYSKIRFKFDKQLWKQMFRYAFPVLVAGVAFSINETFDRILLDRLLPADIAETEIGMYSACYKIALFMTLFATAYRLGIEPFFFSHSKTENPQDNYARILEFFVAFGSIILLGVVVFADALKPLIVRSEAYWEAMWIVPIILLANFCLGIYHNLSVWYKITDRTKFGAYISIIGALITLVINFVFIETYSYKASAVATLIAYAVMMLLSYVLGRKYYPVPYNLKKIGLYMSLSILLSFLSFYRFRGDYMAGISMLIVFLMVVFFLEKQQLKQLLKN
ncbi:lipopolysaccharide biosynthesis protein [Psychroserpens sp.]|uniref:lipopolysaccharide biosynthesis protein n=1 Tax=Psychroserpens sp. TaxID=2020870 RepID=UPI001B0774E8|nr:oligosaccharide flippase family protein [Psychroserpens sp.]MBO6605428.1 oligosaccharide flippase family protein [Psychroserpens sp.]MBO6630067.1 oligosaccharide flippase family protein [Psychroserpens sp.]MBO6653763.1 oligosaccharide flippase family protein [Psychroserpens sp.]MBO6682084.1 oligosaccharide flippase family protein [Psychroserpens sp.]MBO6748802.1 oligosaccharide flippase family protein [Psychroserpens sp.]